MNIIKIILGMGFLFFMNVPTLSAQLETEESPHPLDPSIRYGQLANGFTYYIKHLDNASEKINLHLIVKTGSWHQRQDQLDFAHTIEHLAFTCSQNFPLNPAKNPELLVSLGMKNFDIDARTEGLCTLYNFDLPSNNINALDTGLLWFHDISNLVLTEVKIDTERGPLRQEVTYKQGSTMQKWFTETQMESQLFPFELNWSNFFEHNQNFSPDSLKTFYKQWYLPDRMGLVIVGNISDIDVVESKIKSRFSDLKGHSKPWKDTRLQYLERPNQFMVVEQNGGNSGKGTGTVEFYLYLRDKKINKERNSWKGSQRELAWSMLSKLSLLNDRFKEAAKTYNTSFSAFGHSDIQVFPAYTIKVTSSRDQGGEAFQKTIRILHQVKELGFTQEEWKNAKQEQLISMQSQDITSSSYWLDQIQNHYVYGTVLPIDKAKKLEQWLSGLSLEDFNTLIGEYFSDIVNDIGIIAPHGQKSMYSEAKVRGWMEEVLEEVPQPYSVPEVPQQLLNSSEISTLKEVHYLDMDKTASSPVIENGRILKKVRPIGVRELILNNGVKIVLDTSSTKNNKVNIHGFSPKGASNFPEEDYFSAINAPLIIKNAGVGELDKFELERFLATTSFWQGAFPYINNQETGITGNADLKDFEKLLQLVYLYFTQPRKDLEAFEYWKLMERNRYLNAMGNTITKDYEAAMTEILGDRKAPKGTRRFQGISKTNMDRAYKFYEVLYGNAGDFTFVVSGNYSENKVLPLLQKYLGNLPNLSGKEICLTNKTWEKSLPKGPLYQEFSPQKMEAFYNMESVMYSLRFIAPATNLTDWKEQIKVDALGALMEAKVQDLRHVKGFALYNMRAFGRLNSSLSCYDIEIRLNVDPEELKAVRKACKEIVSDIKNHSFTEARFKEVIQNRFINKYKEQQKSTFQRLRQLHDYYVYKEPWATLSKSEIVQFIRSLSREDIRETARKYLKEEYLLEFVMQNKSNNNYP